MIEMKVENNVFSCNPINDVLYSKYFTSGYNVFENFLVFRILSTLLWGKEKQS